MATRTTTRSSTSKTGKAATPSKRAVTTRTQAAADDQLDARIAAAVAQAMAAVAATQQQQQPADQPASNGNGRSSKRTSKANDFQPTQLDVRLSDDSTVHISDGADKGPFDQPLMVMDRNGRKFVRSFTIECLNDLVSHIDEIREAFAELSA